MPKRSRRSSRSTLQAQKDKATLPNWLRWLLSELHKTLRQALVGTLITIFVSVLLPYLPDNSWGSSPEVIHLQYTQL